MTSQVKRTLILMSWILTATLCFGGGILSYAQEPQGVEATKEEPVPLDLSDTEWDVTMAFVNAKGKKETEDDKLFFRQKQFISEKYEDKGYAPTNYSAVVEPNGRTKFGTMQIKGKETAFWKGTIKDNSIDGSVHTQFPNGETRTVYFNGKLVKGVLVPLGEKKPEPEAAPVTDAAVPGGEVSQDVVVPADVPEPPKVEEKAAQ